MVDWTKDLPEGFPIGFDLNGLRGTGNIRGIVSHLPGVTTYIVEMETASGIVGTPVYPYSCLAVPSGNLSFLE